MRFGSFFGFWEQGFLSFWNNRLPVQWDNISRSVSKRQASLGNTSDVRVDSLSPGPAGPAAGWWSCLLGSTPPGKLCRRDRSRSPASYPGGSTAQRKEVNQGLMEANESGSSVHKPQVIFNLFCFMLYRLFLTGFSSVTSHSRYSATCIIWEIMCSSSCGESADSHYRHRNTVFTFSAHCSLTSRCH